MHVHLIHRFGHVVGGTLLVTGITLGVGMLAMPLATAAGGFLPSILIYLICWLFMLCTGLLILEACAWMPKGANLVTMADKLLGKGGKVFCWVFYLFLFSCLMVAHAAGGGNVVGQIAPNLLPAWGNILLYTLIFFPIVCMGTLWVDRLNLLLMVGIALTYLTFVGVAIPHLNSSYLASSSWSQAWLALPVIFTAFGYQNIIPTLVTYLDRDFKKVRKTIIFGTTLPLIIYLIWEFVILGIVPKENLIEAMHQGQNAVNPLGSSLNAPFLLQIGQIFAFFALTTSFLGIAMSFVDFLADGFKVAAQKKKKLLLCFFVFFIPAFIAMFNPKIFFIALNAAGGLGVVLLLGAMPIVMVWRGRYAQKHSHAHQQIPGGKLTLLLLMIFVILELAFELFSSLH